MLIFLRDIFDVVRLAAIGFFFAFPIVAAPILAEGIQHVVEFHLGMFNSNDGVQPGAEQTLRAVFGGVKVATFLIAAVFLVRFFAFDRNVSRALGLKPRAFIFIGAGVGVLSFAVYWSLVLGPNLLRRLEQQGISIPYAIQPHLPVLIVMFAVIVAGAPFERKLNRWLLGKFGLSSLTKADIGRFSRQFGLRAIALIIGAIGPAFALHYWLNVGAPVDKPVVVQAAFLAADAVLIGYMSALLAAILYVMFQEVAKPFMDKENETALSSAS